MYAIKGISFLTKIVIPFGSTSMQTKMTGLKTFQTGNTTRLQDQASSVMSKETNNKNAALYWSRFFYCRIFDRRPSV